MLFTIGTAADMQLVAVPASVTENDGAPTWLRAGGRWVAFAGLLLTLAIWPVWNLAIAPALRRTPGTLRPGLRLIGRLTITAFTLATAGPNHLRLALDAVNVPPDAGAVLRLTSANDAFGIRKMTLAAVGGNAWEGHGSEFSLAGDWTIEAIVRKVGEYQWQAASTATIGEPEAATALPGQPWRFSDNAIVGIGMLVIGAVAAAWAVTTTRSRSRKESGGIAVAGPAYQAPLRGPGAGRQIALPAPPSLSRWNQDSKSVFRRSRRCGCSMTAVSPRGS